MLDGLSIRDLQQLIRLSRRYKEPLTAKKLLTLYRYGESSSPWEDLNSGRLTGGRDFLTNYVKGQDHAVEKVMSVIIRAFAGLSGLQHSSRQQTPKGILFFVGPTGVGKTELAKATARFLFGEEDACIRFDMSEFNHEHSDQRLVGAPPGYVGYEEGGQLTNAVKERPFSVILFDEIEKAHGRILDKFLQILEDGRLTDGKGETVSFSETVVIFTSNIGAADIERGDCEQEDQAKFIAAVRNHFIKELKRPELLNRIGDNIVPFNFLTDASIRQKIILAKLNPVRERLKEKYRISDMVLSDEQDVIDVLVSGFDEMAGGRGLLNMVASRLIDPLAEFLFEEGEPESYAGKSLVISRRGTTSRLKFSLE
jgi:ATP-dependent Clp protease ATP-binding subunit ClpA